MTNQQHPITPPPELFEQWLRETPENEFAHIYITTQAARWGADQELEACVEWLVAHGWFGSSNSEALCGLRAARRPAMQPADGEVAELVAWLEDEADQYDCIAQAPDTSRKLRRAASLLERLSPPQPVPAKDETKREND